MAINIKRILEKNTSELENGNGLTIHLNDDEPKAEIVVYKMPPKPTPRPSNHRPPRLWPKENQYNLIAEHATPSGLVVPDSRTLSALPLAPVRKMLPSSALESTPTGVLRKMGIDVPYRPRETWRDDMANRIIVVDAAEITLHSLILQGNPKLQKYFANGGGANIVIKAERFGTFTELKPNAGKLWNIDNVAASTYELSLVDNRGHSHISFSWDLKELVPNMQNCPLLTCATVYNNTDYNNHDSSQLKLHAYEMAMRICEDFEFDPAEYPAKSGLHLGDDAVQFSALTKQYEVKDGVPFRGAGGGIRYFLQKRPIEGKPDEYVYLPVSFMVARGSGLTRPSYVPPEKPLFYRQDEIVQNDGRPVFMTTQLDFAFEAGRHAEGIVTTAWRLEDCLSEDGVLPWGIFKGRAIFYLLVATTSAPNAKKREFEMAMRICAKLKSAGSAHPKIITVIDRQIGEVVYEENAFWKLRNDLGIEDAEMAGFPDLSEQKELPGGPTAIDYIRLKMLMIILGEPKTGKTWMALLLACKMAFSQDAPKAVVYFYGEGEKYELEERLEIVKNAWCSASNAADGEVVMVNLKDRDWGEEGFDLKLKDHQNYFNEKLEEVKKRLQYPLEAIILDNYASIMGKNQEGSNAIKLLEFIKKYQRQGLAVLLACHTNSKLEIAGSEHLKRRTNGIICLTKKSLWQEDIKQEMDAAVKKAAGIKKDPISALQAAFDEKLAQINEEEDNHGKIDLHISFKDFRDETPPPEEITIDIPAKSISATIVTGQVKKDFLAEYRDKLMEKMQADDEPSDEDMDKHAKVTSAIPAQPQPPPLPQQSPYTFDEIKGMGSIEKQKEALRNVVEVCMCKTRPELADALKISEDTLKNFMKGNIHNEEIGLKDKAGRPSKMV